MKSFKFSFLTVLLLFLITEHGYGSEIPILDGDNGVVNSSDYVLIINFQLESLQWKHNIEDEVTQYLKQNNVCSVYSEHIKALDIVSVKELNKERERLFLKYINPPRAVIFIGPAAMPFFADAINERWKDVPIIDAIAHNYSISIDNYFSGKIDIDSLTQPISDEILQTKYNITGIRTHNSLKENVELISEVLPDLNHLAVITDERIGSYILRHRIRKMMVEDFPDISLEFITSSDMSTSQMLDRVSQFEDNTGVIFYNWALRGSNTEDYFVWNNIYKTIGNISQVPIFVLWDMNIENGEIAGGHFNRLYEISDAVIDVLKRILSGTPARDIPFISVKKEKSYLNYANLEKYSSSNISYPSDAVYYQKPENVFFKYRYYFILATFLIGFIVIYGIQRIHFLNRAKIEKENELKKQKQLQEEIGLHNFKLALALEVSTINPWVWDLKNKLITLDDVKMMINNPNGVNNFKIYKDSVLLNRIHPDDREKMISLFDNMREGKINYLKEDCRMTIPRDHGEYNWYMFQTIVYEKDSTGKPLTLIGTTTMITDTKEIEIELTKARDAATASDRLKTAFLATLSHEIRTPLNAIVGFSSVLINTEDPHERQEMSIIIQQNNKMLLALINDILEISKIESGTAEFTYTNIDVNKVLNEIKLKFEEELKSSEVIIEISAGLSNCMINTEKRQLKQVLSHLMSNATKFTDKGVITIGFYPPIDDKIRFFVKDTGCGIPQDQLTSIFGRFVKLNHFQQGTGLGLSLAHLILEKMQGTIGVSSELGVGSEFWFDIPYKRVNSVD